MTQSHKHKKYGKRCVDKIKRIMEIEEIVTCYVSSFGEQKLEI